MKLVDSTKLFHLGYDQLISREQQSQHPKPGNWNITCGTSNNSNN